MAQQTFTDCFTLAVGCILYTSNSGTTPVAAGYYSNGTDCYTVNSSGVITSIGVCPTSTTTTTAPTTTTSTSTSTTTTTAPTTTTSTSTSTTTTTAAPTTTTSTTSTSTTSTSTTTTTIAANMYGVVLCPSTSSVIDELVYVNGTLTNGSIYRFFQSGSALFDGINCWNVISNVFGPTPALSTIISGPFVDCATCNSQLSIQVTLVGGGGGSGWSEAGVYPSFGNAGGGGGAGRFVTYTSSLANGTYPITIGTGGAAGTFENTGSNGTNTVFQTNVAPGGGGGGAFNGIAIPGQAGGSGGGGGYTGAGGAAVPGSGGLNITGSGNAGGNNSGGVVYGDSGGGAGGPAGAFGVYALGVTGSNGQLYAQGGAGGRTGYAQLTTSGSGGSNTAGNVAGAMPGLPGIGLIRYLGSPVATGGAITTSGSYTYHTFTSSSNFIY